MPIQPSKGVTPELSMVVTDSLAVELQNRPGLSVVTPKDIEAALGFERQKSKLNAEIAARTGEDVCTDNSCLAEIGGALGVDRMVSGTLTLVGQTYFLTVQSFDPRKATVVGRVQHKAKVAGEDELVDAAKPIVEKLFGTPAGAPATPAPQKPVAQSAPEAPRMKDPGQQPKPQPPPRNSKLSVKMLEAGQKSTVLVKMGSLQERCESLTLEKPCEFMLPKGYAHVSVEGDVGAKKEIYVANTYHQVAEVTEPGLLVPLLASGGMAAAGLGVLGGALYACESNFSGIDRRLNGENAEACFGASLGGAIVAGLGGLILTVTALTSFNDRGEIEVKTERVRQAEVGPASARLVPKIALDLSPRDEKGAVRASWRF
ncbi:MAG: hypothetical protein ACK4N5_11245 [Myxococcales bacterium]